MHLIGAVDPLFQGDDKKEKYPIFPEYIPGLLFNVKDVGNA